MFDRLLSKRGLSFDRLRALVDLAEAGSVTKAAGGDPTRQSQYSRQIKELEQFFGVPLTERHGKGIALTSAGRRLAQIARETLLTLDDFLTVTERQPVQITVGAGDSLLQWLVLPRLGRFQPSLPNTQFLLRNLRTRDIVEGLTEMTLDLGLVRETGVSSSIKTSRLFRLQYSLFVPRGLASSGGQSDLSALLRSVPLATQFSAGAFRRSVEEAFRRMRVAPNVRLRCETFPQACRAVLSGEYGAILPTIAAVDLPPERFVQLAMPTLKSEERSVCLAWNPKMARLRSEFDRVVGKFRETLTA